MIRKFLDKYFPYQFKVRLTSSYTNQFYYIEYTHFRFWPTWYKICTWDSICKWTGIITWDENYKSQFKSIKDIYKHYDYWEKIESDYYRCENKRQSENAKHNGKIVN